MNNNMKNKKITIFLTILFLLTFIITGCWVDTGIAKNFNNINYDTYDIDYEEIFELGKISSIEINGNVACINFYKSESNDVKVHLYGNIQTNYKPELIVNNNTNSVVIETKKEDVKNISIRKGELLLDVYLPEIYDKNIDISSLSGSINIGDYSLDKLVLSSISGSIEIKNINADEIDINTTSGDITADNIICNDDFKSYSVSGECEIGELQSKTTKCDSTSGDVNIESLKTNDIEINTVSGEISIQGNIKSIDVNTTSGDVDVKTNILEGDINIETVSGELQLKLPEDADFNFVSETVSGTLDTQLKFTNLKINKNKSRGTKGNGKYDVELETVSGDITIY